MTAAQNIEKCISELSSREQEYRTALLDEADAEHAFKMRHAKELLAADGTEAARKATALVASEREHGDYLKKAAIKEFTREKLRDCQSALSAHQSLLNFEVRTNFGQMTAGA